MPNLDSSMRTKSVKNAVICGPRLKPKAIIRKACTAAIWPFTSLPEIPLIASKPIGAKELIKNREESICEYSGLPSPKF